MKVMYKLKIKETSGHILTPSWTCDEVDDRGQKWVEDFFGCHQPDVIDYSIERVML